MGKNSIMSRQVQITTRNQELFTMVSVDMFTFKIDRYFDEACDFIGKAVGTKKTGKFNGKILVHCKEGVSRSATLVLAYLVRDQEMTLQDAVSLVRSKREILPNQGFLQQLIDYSDKLGRTLLLRNSTINKEQNCKQ